MEITEEKKEEAPSSMAEHPTISLDDSFLFAIFLLDKEFSLSDGHQMVLDLARYSHFEEISTLSHQLSQIIFPQLPKGTEIDLPLKIEGEGFQSLDRFWKGERDNFHQKRPSIFDTSLEMALKYFEKVCQLSFERSDEHSLKVLNVFERSKGTNGVVEVELFEVESEEIRTWLSFIGMFCCDERGLPSPFQKDGGRYHWNLLFPGRFIAEFELAKNRTRKEFHSKAALQRNWNLKVQLETNGKQTGSQDYPIDFAKEQLRSFIKRHGKNPSAIPFLKGIRGLLEMQRGCPVLVRWTVANYVFTESGGSEFLQDSVALLKNLQLEHRITEQRAAEDLPKGEWQIDWQICESMSDKNISSLMKVIPKGKSAHKPSGTLLKTEVPRKKP